MSPPMAAIAGRSLVDLTRNDTNRQQISGGLTPDNIGVEYAGVIFALTESAKEAGLIWAGTNDGQVQVTRDGGKSWSNVTKNLPNFPEWGTVDNIEASRYDAGTAYLTVDGHQVNFRDPFVYKTADYGKTWTLITNGIPHNMLSYAHCVREDPVRKGLLYLGTEGGLYVSFDDGKNWQPLQSGLPHAPVYWLTVQERFHDLAVATYGRGFWILDDITALEQSTPEVASAKAHLFAPRDAYRFKEVVQPAAVEYDPTTGKNPPYGAPINFYLKANLGEKDVAKLTITDASGKKVREFECRAPKPGASEAKKPSEDDDFADVEPPACEVKAGINRVWWDLRSERSTQIRMRTTPQFAPDVPFGPEGWRKPPALGRLSVLALPGTYGVTLTLGEEKFSQKLTVLKDPHTTGSESDIQAQTRVQSTLYDEMNALAATVNQMESLRAQLVALGKELGTDDDAKPVRKATEELGEKLAGIEGTLLQLKLTGRGQDDCRWSPMLLQKVGYLFSQLDGNADFPPTTQQSAVQEELRQRGDRAAQDFQQFVGKDLAAFNSMLRERNISNIFVKTK